ncbi:MAG: glycosyltransferase family 4 protein [Rhodothermales bacterium]
MRILILSAAYPPDPGGVATHVANLAHGLVHAGRRVFVITLNKDDTPKTDGGGLLTIWKLERRSVPEYNGRRVFGERVLDFALKRWYEIEPDIIHVHDLDSLFIGWMLKSVYSTPLVMTVHRAPSPWRDGRFREKPKDCFMETLRRTQLIDGLVVPSQASARVLREQGFGDAEGCPIQVIPHGISNFLRSIGEDPLVVEQLRLKSHPTLIFCPSRADEHKDVETFLEAAGHLKIVSPSLDLVFLLACDHTDENYLKLASRAKNLGLVEGEDIYFRKFLYKEMATVYRYAKICVVPSRRESFGLSVLEAFLFDVPVVAANTSALREIITNHQNGLLFTDGDPKDLADQVLRILLDSRMTEKLREGARKTLQKGEKYHQETIVKAYETFYERILDG